MDVEDLDAELDRLAEDFVGRLRQGEATSVEDVAARHPHLASRIRRLFPLLAHVDAAPVATSGRVPAASVGPYRLRREVGRGGMGRVFEATATEGCAIPAGTRVAVKLIHPHLVADPEALARFFREAEVGRRVAHANVVRTLDAGSAPLRGVDTPYLVLEFVEGQTLRALLTEVGAVSERLARIVALEVADGLAALHAAGAIHRDVKPENVIVTPDERVRLMDLGVAVVADAALEVSRTGQFVGTLLYAAPEVLAGASADARSDLYALGLVLGELLLGRHPARPATAGRPPEEPALVALPASVSPFFEDLVRELLARDPARRPRAAADVVAALREGELSAWWRKREERSPAGRPWRERRGRAVPLRGRDATLADLDAAWERTARGAAVVLVEGEPGVGKTRLLTEWAQRLSAREPGVAVLVADHAPRGDATPPLAAAVRERLGDVRLEARLVERLGLSPGMASGVARALRGEAAPGVSGDAVPGAVARLLASLAEDGGLVVVADDLHQANASDVAMLLRAARVLRDARALILVATRPLPEGHAALGLAELPGAVRVRLEGLDTAAATDLAREVLGSAASRVPAAPLAAASGGNPLFLLELARAARDVRPSGAAPLEVPGSVRELLDARLAGLDRESRELLEAAACSGERFDPVLVADATGTPRIAALKRCLRLDRESDLLRAEGRDYRFRHPLVRETLLAALPEALRAGYRVALAEATEQKARAAGGELPLAVAQALAQLYAEGGRLDRAAPHLARALESFVQGGRHDLATRLLVAAGGPEGLRRVLAGADLARALIVAGDPGTQPGDATGCLDLMREAREAAREAGDDALLLQVDLQTGWILTWLCRFEEALSHQRATAERAAARGDRLMEGLVRSDLNLTLFSLGRLAEALEEGRRGLELVRREPAATPELVAWANVGRTLVRLGRVDEARTALEQGLRRAREAGNREQEAETILAVAVLDADPKHAADALRRIAEGGEIAYETGRRDLQATAALHAARIHSQQGSLDEALVHADRALEITRGLGTPEGAMASETVRADILLNQGRFAEAWAAFEHAVREAERLGHAIWIVQTRQGLARVATYLADFEGARRCLDVAAERIAATGARREEASHTLAEARLADVVGGTDERIRAWQRAIDVHRELAMTIRDGWLLVGRGAARADAGDADGAREDFEAALGWSRTGEAPGLVAVVRAHQAAAGLSDTNAARAAIEGAAARLPLVIRLLARTTLAEVTREPRDAEAARADLDVWIDGAPPEARSRIRETHRLARRVLALGR